MPIKVSVKGFKPGTKDVEYSDFMYNVADNAAKKAIQALQDGATYVTLYPVKFDD